MGLAAAGLYRDGAHVSERPAQCQLAIELKIHGTRRFGEVELELGRQWELDDLVRCGIGACEPRRRHRKCLGWSARLGRRWRLVRLHCRSSSRLVPPRGLTYTCGRWPMLWPMADVVAKG
eukprot:6184938-Prymnesium_polylepis.1